MKRATITYIKEFDNSYSDYEIYQVMNELVGQDSEFVEDNLKIEEIVDENSQNPSQE